MSSWPLNEAKAKLSELVDTTVKKGPQFVTVRGVEKVVMISVEEYRKLKEAAKPSVIDVLLAPEPRFDIPLPDRKQWRWRRRPPVEFE